MNNIVSQVIITDTKCISFSLLVFCAQFIVMENGKIDLTIKCLLNRVLYFTVIYLCSAFLTVFMEFISFRRTPLQDIPCDSIEDASQWCKEAFQEKVNKFFSFHNNVIKQFPVLFLEGERAGGELGESSFKSRLFVTI